MLALHQAGMKESVAIMGTALTQEQIAELARAAGTVYLALDADRAGQEAMLRAARMRRGARARAAVVDCPRAATRPIWSPGGGPEPSRPLLDGAISVPEFQVRRVLAAADLITPARPRPGAGAVRPDRSRAAQDRNA